MTSVTCVNEKCQITFDSGLEHSVDGIVKCPRCATRQRVQTVRIEPDLASKKATRARSIGRIKFLKIVPPGAD